MENLESIIMQMTPAQLKLALMITLKGCDLDYAILVSAGKQIEKSYLNEAIKKFKVESKFDC